MVSDYNATPHSTHKLPPQDVDHTNRDEVYKKLYPSISIKTVCKLQIGDKVRKIIEKDIFEKGYTQNWSDQIFIIAKVKQKNAESRKIQ